jgi:hypothetical protein
MLTNTTVALSLILADAPSLGIARHFFHSTGYQPVLSEPGEPGAAKTQAAALASNAAGAEESAEPGLEEAPEPEPEAESVPSVASEKTEKRREARKVLHQKTDDPEDPGGWRISYIPRFDPQRDTGYDFCQHIQVKANRRSIGLVATGSVVAVLASGAALTTPILLARAKDESDAAGSTIDMGAAADLRDTSDRLKQASLWVGMSALVLGGVATFLIARGKAAERAQGRAIGALAIAHDDKLGAYAECLKARVEWRLGSADSAAALNKIQDAQAAEAKAKVRAAEKARDAAAKQHEAAAKERDAAIQERDAALTN